jgi:hypothetical protein
MGSWGKLNSQIASPPTLIGRGKRQSFPKQMSWFPRVPKTQDTTDLLTTAVLQVLSKNMQK